MKQRKVGLLIAAAGTVGFVVLAFLVHNGYTQALDEKVLLSFRNPANLAEPLGTLQVQEAGRDLTALGGIAAISLLTAAVTGYLLLAGRYAAAGRVLLTVLGGLLLSSLLKQGFSRPRPEVVPALSHVYTSSFPSGHSFLSAVVYLSLGAMLAERVERMSLKIYFLLIAVLLPFLVGLSRVYVGVHYPSDVLGGWLAGAAWAALCWLAKR